MGVLLAKSMGNHVTVISTSNKKEALAKQVGADNYVISKDEESMVFWLHEFFFSICILISRFFSGCQCPNFGFGPWYNSNGSWYQSLHDFVEKERYHQHHWCISGSAVSGKNIFGKKKNESIFTDFFFFLQISRRSVVATRKFQAKKLVKWNKTISRNF